MNIKSISILNEVSSRVERKAKKPEAEQAITICRELLRLAIYEEVRGEDNEVTGDFALELLVKAGHLTYEV